MASGRSRARRRRSLAYLNPFIAQVDVLCGTESSFGGWCSIESGLVPDSSNGVILQSGDRRQRCRSRHRSTVGNGGFIVGTDGTTIDTTGLSPDDIQAIRRKLAIGNGGGVAVPPNGGQLVARRRRSVRRDPRRALAEERRGLARPVRDLPRRCRPSSSRRPGAGGCGGGRPERRGRGLMTRSRRWLAPAVAGGRPGPRRSSRPTRAVARPGRSTPRSSRSGPALAPHRRRLWLRRHRPSRPGSPSRSIVVAELVLWTLARFVPLDRRPLVGARDPGRRPARLARGGRPGAADASARPRSRSTPRAGLGDRVSSALELAVGFPASAGPGRRRAGAERRPSRSTRPPRPTGSSAASARDALRGAPDRASRPVPAALLAAAGRRVALVAALLLVPSSLLPNPQDAVDRPAAAGRARRRNDRPSGSIDVAKELEAKGGDADDPRTRLAQELRDLARQLRERPSDLDANLARLGSVETDVRAQLDPANEQRAASLTSLSRSLSRAATGKPEANRDGDPQKAQRRPQGPRRQARRDDARAAARPGPPAGRAGGDGVAGRRRGRRRRCATRPRASRRATRRAPGRRSTGSARR